MPSTVCVIEKHSHVSEGAAVVAVTPLDRMQDDSVSKLVSAALPPLCRLQ